MNTMFQVLNASRISLSGSKLNILSKDKSNTSILIFDSDYLVFREYIMTNKNISTAVCDPNIQILLIFEELEQEQLTQLYSGDLEKSFTPISKTIIPATKLRTIDWCNSRICALIFENCIVLYDILLKKILTKIKSDYNNISRFLISKRFTQLFFQYQDGENKSICLVLTIENQNEVQKFENCASCKLIEEQDDNNLLMVQYQSNKLAIMLAKFDEGFRIERKIECGHIYPHQNIMKVAYRKQMQELLLLDSSQNLHIYTINADFQINQKVQTIRNIIQFNVSLLKENLILIDDKNQLILQKLASETQIECQIYQTQTLSLASQVKKRAIQGILTDPNIVQQTDLFVQQYRQDFEHLNPKFKSILNINFKSRLLPLVDFRILNLDLHDNFKFKELIPKMDTYAETQSVKKHLNQLEAALKGDNPILCEGGAACGKTSIIQYLAYKNRQPLIIMNLSSFSQISDLIGKVEILPGFKFEYQLGPFAKAVQEGLWILLDEANLASDSILRVIEDVLELGYITIYGCQINSHVDLVDGTLTIKKHQNFKLFLTQNPATDQKFASSRNIFSPSLMSQFITIKFEPISSNDLHFIIDQIIGQKQQELKEQLKQHIPNQQLSQLLMIIYEEIKQKNMDDGLFTLRDIVQIIDLFFLCIEQIKEKVLEILSFKDCMKLISTQFIPLHKNRELINYQIDQNKVISNANKLFFSTKNQRESEIQNWNSNQPLKFLSFHKYLFQMLTLCYKTKRAALIVGQQYCGKLSSVLLWLKFLNISKYEVLELSSNTTTEDLFGKYQPTQNGFDFILGPVTRCFNQGAVLILTNFEAPDCALIESLNGILERKFNQLIVQNEKFQKHENFAIIALSSDFELLEKKMTPSLKSRFLSLYIQFRVNFNDITLLLQSIGLTTRNLYFPKIIDQLMALGNCKDSLNLAKKINLISFNKIIRFLKPIQEIQKFAKSQLNQALSQKIFECINFFLALCLQDNKSLLNENIKIPINYQELLLNDGRQNNYVITESRKRVADIIATAIIAKIPIVLQGSAGVGKTKLISTFQQTCKLFESTSFHYINMNQNTDINDLMGQFVSTGSKDKIEFKLKKGPLFLGMEQGGIVLIDEANLADASLLNFLANVVKYPSEFHDPVSDQIIKVHEKFRIFFAQNPPSYNGRNLLPDTLASKVIVVNVPNYTLEEVLQICTESQPSIQNENQIFIKNGMEYFLTKLIQYPKDGNERCLNINGTQFTLRQFIRFRNRLTRTCFSTNEPNWENILQLHQMILFPKNADEEYNLECQINKIGYNLFFSIINQQAQLQISFKLNKKYFNKFQTFVENLNSIQRLALCKIAFCYYFKENILISGETSSKTYLSKLFSELVEFQNQNPFELIYINSETNITDLFGSMESHTKSSYYQYCLSLIRRFNQDMNQDEKKTIEDCLQKLKQSQNSPEFFDQTIKNIGNQFPFIERGLTFNARFGGVVCLKNISLAEQSVIEGLNALLEIEPHFIVNGQEIKLHKEFIVIATINTTFGGQLSDALESRLTKIRIQVPEFLNPSQKIDVSYEKYIMNKIPDKTQYIQIILFIEKVLISTKEYKELFYQNISNRKFYQWMSFLNLDLEATYQQKLALGFQFVVLDNYKVNFEEVIKNPELQEHYQQVQNKIQLKLKEQQFFNSQKIIMNPITNKIIQRIYSAFSTKYIPCLIGPPGVGKSAIAQEIANIIKKKFCRICCSDSLSVEDLFGSYAPKIENNKVVFVFQQGYLAQAISQNSLILFDEINLASPEILSTLQALFNTDEKEISIKDSTFIKEKCVFLCSMNPSTYQGRQELPQCISNLLCEVYIEAFNIDQVIEIFKLKYQKEIIQLQKAGINFTIILDLHKELALLDQQQQKSKYAFNIRFLENLLSLFSQNFLKQRQKLNNENLQLELIIVCLDIIYVQHFYQTEFSQQVLKIILDKFGLSQDQWKKRRVFLEQQANVIRISRQIEKEFVPIFNWVLSNQIIPQLSNNSFVINIQNSIILEKLFIAINSKKVILCQGDSSSGKTSCIIKMANLLNQRFILLPIHSDLETNDLLGSFAQVNPNHDEIQQELERLSKKLIYQKRRLIGQNQNGMQMKYVEGVLKICCKFGYWLILDNINLARAEIVERLNSLGEDQPRFFNNEFGDSNTYIIPHENFRLICLQNPTRVDQNQLSPPFYSRCIKINFEIDLKHNSNDIIEILTIKGLGQQSIQQDNVILANNLLKQVIFIKEHTNAIINLRNIIKAFKMIQENGFQQYDQIMEIVFGSEFKESKKNPYFPIFDLQSHNVPDTIIDNYTDSRLNKLVSSTLKTIDIPKKFLDLRNISQFLKANLSQKEIQVNQRFIEGLGQQIFLVNFLEGNQYDLGCYEFQVQGELIKQFGQQSIKIYPTFLSLFIKSQELKNLLVKSKFLFQKQSILAEARLSEGQMLVSIQQPNDLFLVPLINSLIGPSQQQFFKIFKHMLSKSEIECSMQLDQYIEIFFNFKLLDYSLSYIPNLKFKNISGQISFNKENIVTQFSLSFDLQLELNQYFIKKELFSRVDNLSSFRGEIIIPPENQINIFQDYGCFNLFSNINIVQSPKFASYLDLKERKLEINLECENSIQIYKLPFYIRINRILAYLLLKEKITLNGNIQCTFQIFEKDFCSLTARIEKQKLKLQLSQEQHQINCQNFIKQFLLNYFDSNNYFLQLFVENQKTIIKKLDLITNALYWNCEFNFSIDWKMNIFQNIHLEVKNMDIYCHIDPQTMNFTICFTIEILKFIFEFQVVFDFLSLFSKQKKKQMKMILKTGKNSPYLKDIIEVFSIELKNQLQTISGFNQQQTKQFKRKEDFPQLFNVDNFRKLGEQLSQQFEKEVQEFQTSNELGSKLRFEEFQSNLNEKLEKEINLNYEENNNQKFILSQESFIIWDDQIELKFSVDLLNQWNVSKYLTLCQCVLNVKAKNQSFELNLNGFIKVMNMTLNKFQLLLTPNSSLDLKIENQPLIMQINPISFGFGLLDSNFEDLDIFPKLDQIVRFQYNMLSQKFNGEFNVVKQNSKQNFSDLQFENVKLVFGSSDNLRNIFATLEIKVIFFKQQINFYLQFQPQQINKPKSLIKQLKFTSNSLKNFSFNEFLENSVGITLSQKKLQFDVENFEFLFKLEKNLSWKYSIILQIQDSQCQILENFVRLQNLNGSILYKNQSWVDSCISGICFVRDFNLGSFNLIFNKEVKGFEAKFQLNPKFESKEFFLTIYNKQLNFIFFENIKHDEIKVNLGIYNNKTIFELKQQVKIFSWNNISALKLKNIVFMFFVSEEIQIEKNSNLSFELEILDDINLRNKITIDPLQLTEEQEFIFEFQNVNANNLIQKLNHNFQLSISEYEFFNKIFLNITCKIIVDQNFNFKMFQIDSQKQINSEWYILKIQDFNLKIIQAKNLQEITLTCHLNIFEIPIILQYDQDSQSCKFTQLNKQMKASQLLPFISQKDQYDRIQLYQQDFPIINQELQINDMEIKQQNTILKLIGQYHNFNLYLSLSTFSLILQQQFEKDKKEFKDIIQNLSELDYIFQLEKADCLIIYSTDKDLPFINDLDMSICYQNYLNLQQLGKLKRIGFSCFVQCYAEFKQKLQEILFFIPKNIELEISYQYETYFLIESKKLYFQKENFESAYKFRKLSTEIDSQIELQLTYSYQNFGNLIYNGNICFRNSSASGKLEIAFKNAFGLEWLNFFGTYHLQIDQNNIQSIANLNAKIYNGFADLIVLYYNYFIPMTWAFDFVNIKVKKALEFFHLCKIFPKEFLKIFPNTQQVIVINGQLNLDGEKCNFPKEFINKFGNSKLFSLLKRFNKLDFHNFQIQFNTHQILQTEQCPIVIMIDAREQEDRLQTCCLLYYNGNDYIGKGEVKIDIPNFFLNIMFEILQMHKAFVAFGDFEIILFQKQLKTSANYIKGEGFVLNFDICFENMIFITSFNIQLMKKQRLRGIMQFDLNKLEEMISEQIFKNFFQVRKFEIQINLVNNLEVVFEYQIQFFELKQFSDIKKISWNLSEIQENFKLTIQKIQGLLKILNQEQFINSGQDLKIEIYKKRWEVQNYYKNVFNVDIRQEIEQITREVEQNTRKDDIEYNLKGENLINQEVKNETQLYQPNIEYNINNQHEQTISNNQNNQNDQSCQNNFQNKDIQAGQKYQKTIQANQNNNNREIIRKQPLKNNEQEQISNTKNNDSQQKVQQKQNNFNFQQLNEK
ncbi:unnamed protein product [Paramecium octaurelia]|uniref:AAA+ ATPase domain-containing protein n=1 Tax=Paramecium octaurelia TaxID=43137 RepID=A0A8S1YMN0_PAROT|nr:unnamed protein product [Paramecium octaurelia]